MRHSSGICERCIAQSLRKTSFSVWQWNRKESDDTADGDEDTDNVELGQLIPEDPGRNGDSRDFFEYSGNRHGDGASPLDDTEATENDVQ